MAQTASTPGKTAWRMDVPDNIARLTPYSPGKPVEEVQRELGLNRVIKLASNENPLGPSPEAIKAIAGCAARVHLYPDAAAWTLRQALAVRLNVSPESIVIGNGSDDIIHLLGVTFLQPDNEVVQGDPSFVRYEAAALLNNALCHRVPLTPDWVHDLEAMAARCNARTRLVFIANPNNPTGTIVGREALLRLLERMPEDALLVLDEAYYEYAAGAPEYPDGVDLVREGRNVAVLRTFSKAYGLAGLRIGYGVMHPDIAQWLHRTREPFNVNLIAQVAALAALQDVEHVHRTVAMNEEGKQTFYDAFKALGLNYTPTFANFVWVDLGRECRPIYEALLRRGIITRTGDIFGAPTYLRVTTGTPEENALFLSALRDVLLTGA